MSCLSLYDRIQPHLPQLLPLSSGYFLSSTRKSGIGSCLKYLQPLQISKLFLRISVLFSKFFLPSRYGSAPSFRREAPFFIILFTLFILESCILLNLSIIGQVGYSSLCSAARPLIGSGVSPGLYCRP